MMDIINKDNLPSGWALTDLNSIGEIVSGGTPSTKEPSYWGNDINWISPVDLTGYSKKYIAKGAKSLSKLGLQKSSAKVMPAGSVHFSSRAPIGYVAISENEISTNQGFKSIVPADGIFNEYLYYYLKSAKQLAESQATGTTFKELSGTAFGKLPLPIAPTNEQKRIVAKIETLFSALDKGIENLQKSQKQLKIYRQSLLKHAFEGKLTAKWRAENGDKLVSAEELLKQIEQEKENHYQKQLDDYQENLKKWEQNDKEGKRPNKPKKTKVDPITSDHQQKIWNCPDTWKWLQIGNFSFVTKLAGFEYTDYVQYDDNGDLPVIKAENAGINGFKATRFSKVFSETVQDLKRSYLNGGEVLVVFVGAGTGNVARVPENQNFFLGPNIGMVRPETNLVNTRYLELFCRSFSGKDLLLASVKAVAQPSISMGTIRQTPVLIPNFIEQQIIVSLLEEKLSVVDQLEKDIIQNLKRAETLRQSILKKAFSGKLVPQDPNDEPASILLERIKAEKGVGKPKAKQREY